MLCLWKTTHCKTWYDVLMFLVALFQALDYVSYFLLQDPADPQYFMDDDGSFSVALGRASNFIHIFSHVVVVELLSLLCCSLSFVVIFCKRIDNRHVVFRCCISLSIVIGLILAILRTTRKFFCVHDCLFLMTISLQSIYCGFYIFMAINIIACLASHAITRRAMGLTTQTTAIKTVLLRFALFPLSGVILSIPYSINGLNPQHMRDDDYEWTLADKVEDVAYYCVPLWWGTAMLFIYLWSHRQAASYFRRQCFALLHQTGSLLCLPMTLLAWFRSDETHPEDLSTVLASELDELLQRAVTKVETSQKLSSRRISSPLWDRTTDLELQRYRDVIPKSIARLSSSASTSTCEPEPEPEPEPKLEPEPRG